MYVFGMTGINDPLRVDDPGTRRTEAQISLTASSAGDTNVKAPIFGLLSFKALEKQVRKVLINVPYRKKTQFISRDVGMVLSNVSLF